jgi:hypothetical protein
MQAERLPDTFFDNIPNQPVAIKPFDPDSKRRSQAYCDKLTALLAPFGSAAELFGSTALEVAGKGEWEFAIWLDDVQWYPVLVTLINHFGAIYTLLDDFAVFEDRDHDTPIEIIPMRGAAAQRNQAIMAYWRQNPTVLHAYEAEKYSHAYSKRVYYKWKHNFIADILERL